jgi:DNA-binding GntR family transcriptional regulator
MPVLGSRRDEMSVGRVVPRVSLADQAYEKLRSAIVSGVLAPGDRLIERRLSEQLGVSRTPLREAVVRLVHEGLLTARPTGGVSVTSVNEKDAREIWGIRLGLEGYASGLAATHRTDAELELLRSLVDQQREHLEPLNRDALASVNDRFHSTLYEASRLRYLPDVIETYRKYSVTFRVYDVYTAEEVQEGIKDHERIVAAVALGDAGEAEQAMRAHLTRALRILVDRRVSQDERNRLRSAP